MSSFVGVISNQSTNKIPHDVLDLGKFDTLLYNNTQSFSATMVPRHQGSTCVDLYYQVK